MKEFEETDNEIIEELQENISELENTIEDLTDNYHTLRQDFEEYVEQTKHITNRVANLEYKMTKLVDMSYRIDRNTDIFEIKASITSEMLDYGGPDVLDALYSDMKNEIFAAIKNPATNGRHNA
jgi:chromosome segregation ATPase